ncbi:hypothetical protein HNP47_000849 [Brevundimonas vesicularis]|uniref:Uncharacterized protein n=1 Tax=Brevundimonas vesicularis TaxID=41276 RepID=A0A7W9FSS4_BREVE|nr:hypothetical protein [Brevundimonas vesicularis]MBB5770880.1 hypothetical protein [Brevundimonas vesicularis]
MAKFTNYTQGPKGLNTETGLVYVEAGQTVDVEISKDEAASAKKTGWFSAPKHQAEAAPPSEPTDAEIIDALSADDKAAYDKLDDAGKAKFLADKKAA